MKILIYNPFIIWFQHFATDLELILNSFENKDDVFYLSCDSSLFFCETNPKHNLQTCNSCIMLKNKGLEYIGFKNNNIFNLELYKFRENIKLPYFNNKEELINFKINNKNFGSSVFASLSSHLREPNPNIKENIKFIHNSLIDSYAIYKALKKYINITNADLLYSFNGRYHIVRPALIACKELNINCKLHSISGREDKYYISKNNLIHNIEYVKNEINYFWNKSNNPNKENIAKEWFINKRLGRKSSGQSFISKQHKNYIPFKFDKNKINIGIFISSEDEFEAFDIWKLDKDFNQNNIIKKLINYFENDEKFHFYLRVHPNLKNIENSQTIGIKNLKSDNLTIINAEDKTDTYFLIDKSDIILTFGSTVGIEAVFWEKHVILYGRSFYEDLNCFCKVKNFNELIEEVIHYEKLNTNFMQNKINSLKYGYWEIEKGIKYKYYNTMSSEISKNINYFITKFSNEVNLNSLKINNYESSINLFLIEKLKTLVKQILILKQIEKLNINIESYELIIIEKFTDILSNIKFNSNQSLIILSNKQIEINKFDSKWKYKLNIFINEKNVYLFTNKDNLLNEFKIFKFINIEEYIYKYNIYSSLLNQIYEKFFKTILS